MTLCLQLSVHVPHHTSRAARLEIFVSRLRFSCARGCRPRHDGVGWSLRTLDANATALRVEVNTHMQDYAALNGHRSSLTTGHRIGSRARGTRDDEHSAYSLHDEHSATMNMSRVPRAMNIVAWRQRGIRHPAAQVAHKHEIGETESGVDRVSVVWHGRCEQRGSEVAML